ncbi:diphthine--ammonia ligase isoform X1 [Syzygium oleosum]|uniref:diphthine--ammonia ligase isoform X1 n=1 Tax=Syzygium oleosum TaxID=219896 RepID=UPI0011D19781|nr:diphthine--ammonia ligase isoform X1 [Syzygium oleosum]
MKVAALVSGGKDSCYAMMKCVQYGHQIVALANLMPADDSVDELDSYMYQTVGHQIIVSYANCMGIPLFRRRIQGSTRHQKLCYSATPGDEVEDMYELLKEVKKKIPSIEAVSSGAIASDYQRLRVESVCSRLGLVSLAYLWKQDQSLLLQEMIDNGIAAITVKVAAMGLNPTNHLGKDISFLYSYLHKLKELYGINVCGEGGEYETLTLDCPLFVNARIVLEEFQVILHSSDSIAPVGILHPLAFHLETKAESASLSGCDKMNDLHHENMGLVYEVQAESLEGCEDAMESVADVNVLTKAADDGLQISTKKEDLPFSISCWLGASEKASSGLQDDLESVLRKIEKELSGHGLDWRNVLYVHLYISDMNEFAVANNTYVKFITQEKCPSGVPSRSTIELPLLHVGLGKAYIEVLVTKNQEKRVLHVQSISCWAPSCIGPYSQATLHKNVLYMAGQLGLYPPTMTLSKGGAVAELELALENSEAVAKCFNCSISTSSVLFVVYCSESIPSSERGKIQEKLEAFLKQIRSSHLKEGNLPKVLDHLSLYVLVPDLPKRALVEVKPLLYVMDDAETVAEGKSLTRTSNSSFQHESWHDSCINRLIVNGMICAVVLSVTNETAVRLCSEFLAANRKSDHIQNLISERQMERILRFCIYLLDKILAENSFFWEEIVSLRVYYPVSLQIPLDTLALIIKNAFKELEEIRRLPIFNLIPVLGAGRSTSMDDLITWELFAQRT